MVRAPLCRPIRALFENEMLSKENLLNNGRRSSLSAVLRGEAYSTQKPSLEEKQLLWATFSCKKFQSHCGGAESPESAEVQSESGGGSSSDLGDYECASERIMLRRTGQDLQIETDSSPSKSDPASWKKIPSNPTPPSAPRVKAHSPKDINEMRQMAATTQEEGQKHGCGDEVSNQPSDATVYAVSACMTAERESPTSSTPTPPTVPRPRQAPRSRQRLTTPPGMSGAEEEAEVEPVVSKKTVPVLSARQLTRAEDTEPSESWKRFEKRKLERKERSRSKRRSNQVRSPSGSVLTLKSTYQLRICGLMVSKLAQPAELFSHRNPSMMDDGMSDTEAECTAFRKWT